MNNQSSEKTNQKYLEPEDCPECESDMTLREIIKGKIYHECCKCNNTW